MKHLYQSHYLKLLAVSLITISLTSCGSDKAKKQLSFSKYPMTQEKEGEDTEWTFVDPTTGKGSLENTFETSLKPTPFFNGYATIGEKTDDGKEFFFINSSGKRKGKTYVKTGHFNNDLAPVVNKDEPIKYINNSFEKAFEAIDSSGEPFVKAKNFHNGLAPVMDLDEKWGFINKSGEIAIKPQYHEVSHFHKGHASVVKKEEDETLRGVIDKKGKEVIELTDEYDFLGVPRFNKIRFGSDGDWGFLNLKGKEVIDDDFDQVTSFVNGRASVKEEDEWGAINKKGKEVIDIGYDAPILFLGEYALINERGKAGIINKQGKEVIEPQYEVVIPPVFGEKFLVGEEDELFFIDKQNEQVGTEEYKDMSFAFLRMYEKLTNPYDYDVIELPEKEITTQYFDVSEEVSQILGDSINGEFHGFSAGITASEVQYIKDNKQALFRKEKQQANYPKIANATDREEIDELRSSKWPDLKGYFYKITNDDIEKSPYNIVFDKKVSVSKQVDKVVNIKGNTVNVTRAELLFTDNFLKPNELVEQKIMYVNIGTINQTIMRSYMIRGGVKANEEATLEKITLSLSIDDKGYADIYEEEILERVKAELKGKGFQESTSYNLEPGGYAIDYNTVSNEMEITVMFGDDTRKSASR